MLVRYIVNMIEGAPYLIPTIDGDNTTIDMQQGHQRSKGLYMKIKGGYGSVSWVTDRPIILTGIRVGSNFGYQVDPTKYLMDTLDMTLEGRDLLKEKPVYDVDNYTNIRALMEIQPNLEFKFTYKANTPIGVAEKDKHIWIDIDYLGDPLLQLIEIYCIKKDGSLKNEEDILEIKSFNISRGTYELPAPKIQGYTPVYPTFKINPMPTYHSETNQEALVRIIEYV